MTGRFIPVAMLTYNAFMRHTGYHIILLYSVLTKPSRVIVCKKNQANNGHGCCTRVVAWARCPCGRRSRSVDKLFEFDTMPPTVTWQTSAADHRDHTYDHTMMPMSAMQSLTESLHVAGSLHAFKRGADADAVRGTLRTHTLVRAGQDTSASLPTGEGRELTTRGVKRSQKTPRELFTT